MISQRFTGLAVWLLALQVPPVHREAFLGDVWEEFNARCRGTSDASARRWLAREVLAGFWTWGRFRATRGRLATDLLWATAAYASAWVCIELFNHPVVIDLVRSTPLHLRSDIAVMLNAAALAVAGVTLAVIVRERGRRALMILLAMAVSYPVLAPLPGDPLVTESILGRVADSLPRMALWAASVTAAFLVTEGVRGRSHARP